MICLVDHHRLADLRQLSLQEDPYACRIACLFDSYGLSYDFARFWVQYDTNGQATAAIVRYYDAVTAALTDNSDREELTGFLQVIGFGSLSAPEPLLPGQEEAGVLMRLVRPADAPELSDDLVLNDQPSLNGVYRLLESCRDELNVPPYESFLLDMSHKLRHGTALCITLEKDGVPIACAMTVAQSETCAVIGGVAVHRQFRRRGYGTACVTELCRRLSGRSVLLVREPHRNRAFYEKRGFI